MTDRTSIALPDALADDLEAYKRDSQTWPAFIRETVLPALDADDADAVDYAEIETRCQRAVENALPDH